MLTRKFDGDADTDRDRARETWQGVYVRLIDC